MEDVAAQPEVDQFVLEIVAEALVAIGDEMFVTTQRTSQTPLVYEILDFAVGLTDTEGRMIAQGAGIPIFLGTLGPSVRSVIDKFGLDAVAQGDIFATNDPYRGGGTHLSDVTLVIPILHDGRVVAFAANKAHWTDLGGKDPGSVSNDTRDVFQEGLQIPCVKVFDLDGPNEAVLDLFRANTRLPDVTIGDLHAQAGSVRLAARRFSELCEKHGVQVVEASIEHMLRQSAALAAGELAKLPAGTYEAEDWIDGVESEDGPYRICVKVEISEDEFVCDFTGVPPHLSSPLNCSRTGLTSAVQILYKAITGPEHRVNDGSFDALRVICPDGTMFTAEHPVPVSTYWEILVRIVDLTWKAVAPAVPERVTAGHYVSVCGDVVTGLHPESGELFILFEPTPGGWGAGPGKDGERGLFSIGDGDTYVMPAEVAEQRFGLRVDQYRFNIAEGDAGAGEWRGGEGVIRDYRITADDATATGYFTRTEFPAWGAAGGRPGSVNEVQVLDAEGEIVRRGGMTSQRPIATGEVFRLITGSGGGWGDPMRRDPERVSGDVRNGFVTVEQARAVYGVEVDPDSFEVNGTTPERAAHRADNASVR